MSVVLGHLQAVLHDAFLLFAMVNVVGNLPLFADVTAGMDRAQRNRSFRVAVAVAGTIVLVFAFIGNWLLQDFFQVETCAFLIAGGIVVFAVAVRGIVLGPHANRVASPESGDHLAVFPMGFPFLAGPGTIVTVILLMQARGSYHTAAAAVLVYAAVIPVLHMSSLIRAAAGRIGVLVIPRILYIFIAAKAVSFVLRGLRTCFSEPI